MSFSSHRHVAELAEFDPEHGRTVLAPEQAGQGYWAGCPSVLHDADQDRFLLTYRQRHPRGIDPERGWRCAIAQSRDGYAFTDIWSVEKRQLGTSSMERFSLLPRPEGGYLLYISYVDPQDSRWRIDVLEADTPDGFDVDTRAAVLTAQSTGTEGIKDPYTVRVASAVYMYTSIARGHEFTDAQRREAHATEDIYNVGATVHPTGLAISDDGGRSFAWQGEVLDVGAGWDRYQARLNSVLPAGGLFIGFYDGAASVKENYEERCGLAISADLRRWDKLTPDEPWVSSPHAAGALRYVDAVPVGDDLRLYYEYALPDGSHELRVNTIAHVRR